MNPKPQTKAYQGSRSDSALAVRAGSSLELGRRTWVVQRTGIEVTVGARNTCNSFGLIRQKCQLLVSPLIDRRVVPYSIPYRSPFKEVRLRLMQGITFHNNVEVSAHEVPRCNYYAYRSSRPANQLSHYHSKRMEVSMNKGGHKPNPTTS